MKEIIEHKAYELLKTKYVRVCLDYIILLNDGSYTGLKTHEKAIIEAFKILQKRFSYYDDLYVNKDKMVATQSNKDEFLQAPPDNYCYNKFRSERSFNIPTPIPYWFAFLEPPHGTPYQKADFIQFNKILFPSDENIEVYRWNDYFSNYFDAGKEWWGTGLWTIYDPQSKLMTVIGASLTD